MKVRDRVDPATEPQTISAKKIADIPLIGPDLRIIGIESGIEQGFAIDGFHAHWSPWLSGSGSSGCVFPGCSLLMECSLRRSRQVAGMRKLLRSAALRRVIGRVTSARTSSV